mmetsp:Transcript_17197/g.25605  ORF Transcript_17197/g.25605 Transcript_17197/m.25605 type:complete len:410 (+) Transcript_17197:19-1248(+)
MEKQFRCHTKNKTKSKHIKTSSRLTGNMKLKTVKKLASKSFTRSSTKTKDVKSPESCNNRAAMSSLPPSFALDNEVSSSVPTFNKRRAQSLPNISNDKIGQAIDSLESALHLIKAASNQNGPWVDARHLLDETVAALDDAGLALQCQPARKSVDMTKQLNPDEHYIRELADEVVNKRQRFLGGSLIHDTDGIWTKSVYGECDGFSFGAETDELYRVPDEEKKEKALIVYASQNGTTGGTTKAFAKHLCKSLGGDTYCDLRNMSGIMAKDLAMYKRVYIVCNTSGLGRPPCDGEVFYSHVQLEAMRCQENLEDLAIGDGDEEKPLAGTSVAIAVWVDSSSPDYAKFGLGLTEELVSLGASTALKTITVDENISKSEQKQTFKEWENTIIEMEKASGPRRRTSKTIATSAA